VDLQTLSFALAAGMLAAVNPCGFAMLPAYLALVVLGDGREDRRRAVSVRRALAATAVMALGFVAVFGTFGLVIAPLADSVQRYLPIVTVLIGAVLVALDKRRASAQAISAEMDGSVVRAVVLISSAATART